MADVRKNGASPVRGQSTRLRRDPEFVTRPVEPLWEARDGAAVSAVLRYNGEWDVEAAILRDGERHVSRMSQTRRLAVQWPEEERKFLWV